MAFDFVGYGVTYLGGLGSAYFLHVLKLRGEEKKTDREAKHLALDVAVTLEKYAAVAATNVGNINDHISQRLDGAITFVPPLPAMPKDHKRWVDLDLHLVDALNGLVVSQEGYKARISSSVEHEGGYEAMDQARHDSTLLAVAALTLAARFRKSYKLKPFNTDAWWPKFLSEQYENIYERKQGMQRFTYPPLGWWKRTFTRD